MKTYLEPEEGRLLEGAGTCLRDRLLVRLLFHTGCRISEALALKIEDIDFEQGTVTIPHLKNYPPLHPQIIIAQGVDKAKARYYNNNIIVT